KLCFNIAFKNKEQLNLFILTIIKENQILKRHVDQNNTKILFNKSDRLFYSVANQLSRKVKDYFSIVKPETVLKWTRNLIKNYWIYPHKNKKAARKKTPLERRQLVLKLKNDNIYWGNGKIRGELLKLDIDLSESTIARILAEYRKQGMIKKGLT
ncbi:MAG: hypothetical protein GY760_06860, partial [Deltaproteobacteria bacterium]|nr:hypothetical protein [Deltaproteobacteria bacterium]